MSLQERERFDRYVIECAVGSGGMGQVYRAHDTLLDRVVALKILHPEAGPESTGEEGRTELSARILAEARAAAALNHANVVSIFDVGVVAGTPFIAMELVEGARLRVWIGKPTPLATKLGWLADVARALAAAHARGILHRDIKPENVMVRPDGTVKVLDFGVAKRLAPLSTGHEPGGKPESVGSALPVSASTGSAIVGTPRYMSPEQIRGGVVDARSDQFAWGVLAYELLTGELPWEGADDMARLAIEILTHDPEPLAEWGLGIPPVVDELVRRALAKSRSERHPSMESIVHALDPNVIERATASIGAGVVASIGPKPPTGTDFAPPLATRSSGPTDAVATPFAATRPAEAFAPPASRRRGPTPPLLALLAAGLVGASITVWRLGPRWISRATPSSASSAPLSMGAPRSSAAFEWVLDKGSTPAAATAYRAGVQALRDASLRTAIASFSRATELDPSLASAHLRLAILDTGSGSAGVRRRHRRATELRSLLDAREAALLDAIEPEVVREPADFDETRRRLERVAVRWPEDPEVLLYLAMMRVGRGDFAVDDLLDRALRLDPKLATAWWVKGNARRAMGDVDGVGRAADRCLEIVASAASCWRLRTMVHALRGECASMEVDARRSVALEPDVGRPYSDLATALAARGATPETVRTALEQAWARYDASDRPVAEAIDRIALDQIAGDFASAERRGRALGRLVASEPTAWAHEEAAMWHLDTLLESDATLEAGRYARDLWERRGAWVTQPILPNSDPVPQIAPLLLEAQRRAGLLSTAAYADARRRWLDSARETFPTRYLGVLWLDAFATVAETPDDARAALAALPVYGSPPKFRRLRLVDAAPGKVHLLAGEVDAALPYLRSATASCYALEQPVEHTRAFDLLGRAHEEKGDRAAACDAYAVVLRRWGHATPRSITADHARVRVAALKCPSRAAR